MWDKIYFLLFDLMYLFFIHFPFLALYPLSIKTVSSLFTCCKDFGCDSQFRINADSLHRNNFQLLSKVSTLTKSKPFSGSMFLVNTKVSVKSLYYRSTDFFICDIYILIIYIFIVHL